MSSFRSIPGKSNFTSVMQKKKENEKKLKESKTLSDKVKYIKEEIKINHELHSIRPYK